MRFQDLFYFSTVTYTQKGLKISIDPWSPKMKDIYYTSSKFQTIGLILHAHSIDIIIIVSVEKKQKLFHSITFSSQATM